MKLTPGLPGAIVEDAGEVWVINGERRRGANVAMSDEQFESFRLGYRCLRCHTVQDEPFPEVCKEVYKGGGGCGFRMKADQGRYIEAEFRGEHRYGPTDPDAEPEHRTDSGIYLPRTS